MLTDTWGIMLVIKTLCVYIVGTLLSHCTCLLFIPPIRAGARARDAELKCTNVSRTHGKRPVGNFDKKPNADYITPATNRAKQTNRRKQIVAMSVKNLQLPESNFPNSLHPARAGERDSGVTGRRNRIRHNRVHLKWPNSTKTHLLLQHTNQEAGFTRSMLTITPRTFTLPP